MIIATIDENNDDCPKRGGGGGVGGGGVGDGDYEYDPHKYGDEEGLSLWEATAHYVKSVVGTGILVVPYAFKSLGYALGTAVILTVALLYYHTMHILLDCEYRACRRSKTPNMTLVGATRKIFVDCAPPSMRKIGAIFEILIYLYFGLPLTCALYLMAMSANLQRVLEFAGVEGVKPVYPMAVVFLLLSAFCSIRKLLKFMAPFSAVTDVFTIIVAYVVVACSFVFGDASATVEACGHAVWIPQFFGLFLMGIRSTGIVMPLKNEMIEPRKFSRPCGVLNLTAVFVTVFYTVFGLSNYFNYGDRVEDNILLNLPRRSAVALAIYALNTFGLFVSYVLTFYVNFHTVWASKLEKTLAAYRNKNLVEYCTRIGINVLTFAMAVAMPRISLISAVSGSFGMLVEIILPPILDILLIATGGRRTTGQIFVVLKDSLIIIVGFTLFTTSMIQCVYKIVELY